MPMDRAVLAKNAGVTSVRLRVGNPHRREALRFYNSAGGLWKGRRSTVTPLLNTSEVCRILAVSKITVRRLVNSGQLPCIRYIKGRPMAI